jgi:hypothetical protein
VLRIAAAPDSLRLSYEGGTMTFRPVTATEFVAPSGGARLQFDGDVDGRPRRLILIQDGRRFECPRQGP